MRIVPLVRCPNEPVVTTEWFYDTGTVVKLWTLQGEVDRWLIQSPLAPPHAVAVAGFRIGHMLAWGRFLYVDDLSTLPEARRRGYGRKLLDWLGDEARRLDCEQLHLDSGVTAERFDAHRLYLNAGLAISSFHFARRLR